MLHKPLNRLRPGRKLTESLVLLLLLTFAVTGLISYMGQREGENSEQVRENGLITSAAFAAAGYSEKLSYGVHSLTAAAFRSVVATVALDDRVEEVPNADLAFVDSRGLNCNCTPSKEVLFNYKYDFNTQGLIVDRPIPESERARIKTALHGDLAPRSAHWNYSVNVTGLGPKHPVLFSLVRKDSASGTSIYAIGFGATQKLLSAAVTPVDSFNLILPRPSQTAEPLPDRFAITVLVGNDTLLKAGNPSAYAVTYELNPALGDISIIASVNPLRFNVVAGGSEPISRAPAYVGLLLLVGMLIAAAVMLTKRQGQLAEARTDFVSNVSHELRTPLAQIRMFAETLLLGRARNDTDKRRSLEIIDQEAKRLTALVENVLQLGRSERGVASVTPTEFRLGPTIREAVDRYAQLPRSMNVEFRTEVEDRLVALVDPSALRQIIDNLLDNAVKYGPSGQRVNVGLAMFEEHARLWVDDEGAGIPVRERERVFEPFYRSTLHADSSAGGSGIGLAVVKELTDLLEGRVWAESAPGGGARIIVEFPKAYLQPEEAASGWAVA